MAILRSDVSFDQADLDLNQLYANASAYHPDDDTTYSEFGDFPTKTLMVDDVSSLISGWSWNIGIFAPLTVTYSFPWFETQGAYFDKDYGFGEPFSTEFFGVTNEIAIQFEYALSLYENVSNINFECVIERESQVGDIRFAFSDTVPEAEVWGYAYYPYPYYKYSEGGDIWVQPKHFLSSWDEGKYNFFATMHEIGHALGLKHPFAEGNVLDVTRDNQTYSIMSYTGFDKNIWTNGLVSASTPMILDILAIQSIYGENLDYNSGNDTYVFDPSFPFFKAIWDGGGIDTLDLGGFEDACQISLIEGSYSNLGFRPSEDNSGSQTTYDGTNALSIAYNCDIENIWAGSGSDYLMGNNLDNLLWGNEGGDAINGGSGNDSLYGGVGNDELNGGIGNDLVDGDVGNDIAAYLGVKGSYTLTLGPSSTTITDRNGSEGTDTLINVEKLAFTDRTLDLDNYSSLTQLNDTQFSDLAKVYVAYFNRVADAEGLYFWAVKLAEGMDMETIASYFSQSAEAKALYPDTADTSAFVTAVYSNVLGRTPDLAGFDFWTTVLNNGTMQPATFVLSIIGGAQGADITYLFNKADLGVYFAAIKGMSDVTDAQNVLNIFGDQATSNTAGAKASVDGHYADATASGGGEFIFELVGIVNDPFAAGI